MNFQVFQDFPGCLLLSKISLCRWGPVCSINSGWIPDSNTVGTSLGISRFPRSPNKNPGRRPSYSLFVTTHRTHISIFVINILRKVALKYNSVYSVDFSRKRVFLEFREQNILKFEKVEVSSPRATNVLQLRRM